MLHIIGVYATSDEMQPATNVADALLIRLDFRRFLLCFVFLVGFCGFWLRGVSPAAECGYLLLAHSLNLLNWPCCRGET